MSDSAKICVLGSRKPLVEVIQKRGLEICVVGLKERPPKNLEGSYLPLSAKKFPQTLVEAQEIVRENPQFFEGVDFVLASGEGSMVSANHFRKALGLKSYEQHIVDNCSHKLLMKRELKKHGIPMTEFLGPSDFSSPEMAYQILGDDIIVKEANNSGGKGQGLYHCPQNFQWDEDHLLEKVIVGDEMSVESFIQDGEILFTSTTEYFEKGVTNIVPSSKSEKLLEKVLEINRTVIKALKIPYGMTHLEVYLTEKGILFGEIALRPPGGYIMELIRMNKGVNAWEVYLDLHLGKTPDLSQLKEDTTNHCAAIIYHPGKGVCKDVTGVDFVKARESFVDLSIKGKVNQSFNDRVGVGQEKAHIFLENESRFQLENDIQGIRENFKMEMHS